MIAEQKVSLEIKNAFSKLTESQLELLIEDGWILSSENNVLKAKNEKRDFEISGELTVPFLNEEAEELYFVTNAHPYNPIKTIKDICLENGYEILSFEPMKVKDTVSDIVLSGKVAEWAVAHIIKK